MLIENTNNGRLATGDLTIMDFKDKLDAVLESFVNKNTIVLHVTHSANIDSIMRNGLGGTGKSDAIDNTSIGGDPSMKDGEYVSRFLGVAVYYAGLIVTDAPACIIALRWNDTSLFDYDEDEGEMEGGLYYNKNIVIPALSSDVVAVWKVTHDDMQTLAETFSQKFDDPTGFELPYNVQHKSGKSAMAWLDRHFTRVHTSRGMPDPASRPLGI